MKKILIGKKVIKCSGYIRKSDITFQNDDINSVYIRRETKDMLC